jgi:site-specific DNA-methyltransferase (adenine-specific)
MEKFYNLKEAAEILNVNKETLRRWDRSGKFSSTRHPINNYRVYPSSKVNQLVKELHLDFYLETKSIKLPLPYYKNESGALYNMDALQFLKSIDNESVDLVFADPPYNIKKAEWDTFQSQKQYVDWSILWIQETQRILKSHGSLYVCGFSEILADIKWAASYLFKGCKWLVWHYRNKANLGNDWGRSHESILHFRKSKEFIFNIDEVRVAYNAHTLKYPSRPQAETSQYNNGNGKEYIWEPNPLGAKPKDVFEIPTLSNGSWEKTTHQTQKPVELIKKIVLASSNERHLIVDPFGGSGTTFVVAQAFNRRWLGSEKSKEYCQIIKERLSNSEIISRIASGKDEVEAVQRRQKLRA